MFEINIEGIKRPLDINKRWMRSPGNLLLFMNSQSQIVIDISLEFGSIQKVDLGKYADQMGKKMFLNSERVVGVMEKEVKRLPPLLNLKY